MREHNSVRRVAPDFDDLEALEKAVSRADALAYMTPDRQVQFKVHLKASRNLIAVDPAILSKVRERARAKGISPESLINTWIQRDLLAVS